MLPTIDQPIYDLTLPSSGKEIKVRPFLVKEEKLLLMAAESEDDADIINTTKQVINNCIITEGIDVEKLPFFDIDFLFIALRAKSIGEKIEMQFRCNNDVDDNRQCGNTFYAEIDISEAKVEKTPGIDLNIEISNNISMKMKYPTYTIIRGLTEEENSMERKIKVIVNSIDYIVEGENIHSSKDYSREDLTKFVEGLTEEQFKKLELFIENFPTFAVDVDAKCEMCGFDHHIKYTEFESFF
jgi:hypothetical protein